MKYDKALEMMDRAIAIQPYYGLYYFRSGQIKARMKNKQGACEDWKIAKKLGYHDAEELLLYNCGAATGK
jgi:tetratricopeptide (TPR) repeat protein